MNSNIMRVIKKIAVSFLLCFIMSYGCSEYKEIRPNSVSNSSLTKDPPNNIDAIIIKKTKFYVNKFMTDITNIVPFEYGDEGEDVGIFDQFGMDITDIHGKYKRSIKFKWKMGILYPDLVKFYPNSLYIVAGYQNPFGIMDHEGYPIWTYDNEVSYNMACGDVNGDGLLDCYVASTSLIQLDENGKKVWKSKEEIFVNVDIYLPSPPEKPLIVTLNHAGKIQIRNYIGQTIQELVPREKVYGFRICNWLNSHFVLAYQKNVIVFLGLNGEEILRYRLSGNPSDIYSIRGTSVKSEDGKEYFAVITKFSSITGLSLLVIFSPAKALIYHEIIGGTTGLTAINVSGAKEQMLLVGNGPGIVNKYILSTH